jgi:hypothetical protein
MTPAATTDRAPGQGGSDPAGPAGPDPHADDEVLSRWLWRRLRAAWPLLAVGAAIILTAVLTATRSDPALPLDPGSKDTDGTAALVDVLTELGRPPRVVGPDDIPDARVVLLLRDQLSDRRRRRLDAQVRDGARVVVADPSSPLAPEVVARTGVLGRILSRGCDVPALRDVGEIRPGGGALYATAGGGQTCFTDQGGAWLVITPVGRGHVVALGGPGALLNSRLGTADNAILLTQLLTPVDGGGPVVVRPVLQTVAEGEGVQADALSELVPPGIRVMVWQLLAAFGVLVMWRARRLGRPLADDAPVRLASSELTSAVGALLARNSARAAAAGYISTHTRRRVARRLRLPASAGTDDIADAVAARTGRDRDEIVAVLTPPPPADDRQLLATTAALTTLEQLVDPSRSDTVEHTDVD